MQPPLPTPDELLRTALGTEPTIPPAPADLAAHLPELEILALIGQGGMGAVYRVRRRADGKLLALKVVRPEAGKEAAFTARFAREAEALERLRHANIVAIHGHGAAGPWCWLLMDLVEGANLREIVATGRLSPAQTLALVPPLCAALQYAHDQGVVHRDLKPENILLDATGVPHLVDFGLAKLRDGAAGSDLTNTGAGMGTVHYMAPEQVASAKDVDHRADIYALGVVIYELLTGELPLGRFENPSQRAAVDARIDAVVMKALERDRERRWQEMRQVGAAVAAVGADQAPAQSGLAGSSPSTAPVHRPWWSDLILPGLGLLIILVLPSSLTMKCVLLAFGAYLWWCIWCLRQRHYRIFAASTLGPLLVVAIVATTIKANRIGQQAAVVASPVSEPLAPQARHLIERLIGEMRSDPRVTTEAAAQNGRLLVLLGEVEVSGLGLDAGQVQAALFRARAFAQAPLEFVAASPPATVRLDARLTRVQPDPSHVNTWYFELDLNLTRIVDQVLVWEGTRRISAEEIADGLEYYILPGQGEQPGQGGGRL